MQGFDISAIPAIFILDLLGQATAALGAEFPPERKNTRQHIKRARKLELSK